KHREGVYSFYMHMVPGSIVVSPGQPIGKGDVIGKEGSTGRTTGPHLHFAVGPSATISDANSVDPLNNPLGSLTRTGAYTKGKDCP
ncbi:MAG TPA: M23 family metallopeptidase, partial [Candidatus Saccharimonadales bacterium]|nr:M23 family metallopeptidase [Candidatus Saccharimonadales bacterium]